MESIFTCADQHDTINRNPREGVCELRTEGQSRKLLGEVAWAYHGVHGSTRLARQKRSTLFDRPLTKVNLCIVLRTVL